MDEYNAIPVIMDRVTSLIKALDMLTLLGANSGGYTAQELAEAMNQPRSTVIRVLNTLVEYGLVRKQERSYLCTQAFSDWAQPNRHAAFCVKYRSVLEAVAAATGELVLLGLLDGAGVVHIDYIESDQAVRIAPAPVTRHNIRKNALGKLVLAQRPDLAERWLKEDVNFQNELEQITVTGIAWNREETVKGMIALACHGITDASTEPKIAVAWPAHRFTEAKGKAAIKVIRKACREAQMKFDAIADR